MAVVMQPDNSIQDAIFRILDDAENDTLEISQIVNAVSETLDRDPTEVKETLWELIRHYQVNLTVDLRIQLPEHGSEASRT